MSARKKEQMGGLLMLLISLGLVWFIWNTAYTEGYFLVKASAFAPAAAVIGLALIIFPSYRLERKSRGEDISNLKGLQLLTPRWWAILIIALAVGFLNIYLLGY